MGKLDYKNYYDEACNENKIKGLRNSILQANPNYDEFGLGESKATATPLVAAKIDNIKSLVASVDGTNFSVAVMKRKRRQKVYFNKYVNALETFDKIGKLTPAEKSLLTTFKAKLNSGGSMNKFYTYLSK